jgi:hypothetical protein
MTTIWRIAATIAVLSGSCTAWAADFDFHAQPPDGPEFGHPADRDLASPTRLPPADGSPGPAARTTSYPMPGQIYGNPPPGQAGGPGNWSRLEGMAGGQRDLSGTVLFPVRLESTWYARVDYYHWNERLDGADFVNEDGPMVTIGYQRRVGRERFRFELFGGDIHYDGGAQYDDGTSEPLSSRTGYLGVRGEYDLLFEPDCWPAVSLFVGFGTRLWARDLRDGVTDSGVYVWGYQETWWTVYPYLGLEKRRIPGGGPEFFWGGRIGCTPLNYEYVSWYGTALYPRIGITGQVEAGYRGQWLSLAAYFEAMTWSESAVAQGILQPASSMLTIGLKAGVTF